MPDYDSQYPSSAPGSSTSFPDLGPTRRQNTACDACRQRKVKCNKVVGSDKCQHCISKNYPCTHHIQQATADKKRTQGQAKRPRRVSNTSSESPTPVAQSHRNGTHTPPARLNLSFYPPITVGSSCREVLAYLCSPPESGNYSEWGSEAYRLDDPDYRNQEGVNCVEVFFQIVSIRMPLLNDKVVDSQLFLKNPGPPGAKQLHPALFATIVAWGSKFAENPLFEADRAANRGKSAISRMMVKRTRMIAESLNVHRVASEDHIITSLLIEPLQNQSPSDQDGYHGFWLRAAAHHLIKLKYNHRSVLNSIPDSEVKATMIFAWWMTVFGDSYGSAYYQRKPILDDDDYDVDLYIAEPITKDAQGHVTSSRQQLEVLGYYSAAHALAYVARFLSRYLWRPQTAALGIPVDVLDQTCVRLDEWRKAHLQNVGVPPGALGNWNFVQAVSACASDCTFHVMWIILFTRLDEYGVRELRQGGSTPEQIIKARKLMTRVYSEGLAAAMRISGLAGTLADAQYLKLDPSVVNSQINHAGTLLATLGRPEYANCVRGMEQYSSAYDEAGEQAEEMKRIYSTAMSQRPSGLLTFMRGMDREELSGLKSENGNGERMIVDAHSLYA